MVLKRFADAMYQPDPTTVNDKASVFNLNLMANYCKFGTPERLTNNSMGALMKVFPYLYQSCIFYFMVNIGKLVNQEKSFNKQRRIQSNEKSCQSLFCLTWRSRFEIWVCDSCSKFRACQEVLVENSCAT